MTSSIQNFIFFSFSILLVVGDQQTSSEDIFEEKVCNLTQRMIEFRKKRTDIQDMLNEDGQFRYLPRTLLLSLNGCTTVIGSIYITHFAFYPWVPGESVRWYDFYSLQSVRRIIGGVSMILSKYPEITSLDFFSNLKEISHPTGGYFEILLSNVETFNLTGVTLNVSEVLIDRNRRLCFLENFETNFARKPVYYKVRKNRDFSECQKEGKVCDSACADTSGCLGPTMERCAQCRAFRAGLGCVDSCSQLPGSYRKKNSRECVRCHPECRGTCTGPRSSDCHSCKTAKDGHRCVGQCPVNKFLDKFSKTCRNCSERCFHGVENMTSLCSGPGIENCFHSCTGSRLVDVSSGKRRCRDCHAVCQTGCIGLTEHDCLKCESVKTNVSGAWECLDVCPAGYSDCSDCFCVLRTFGRICYELAQHLKACRVALGIETGILTVFILIAIVLVVCVKRRCQGRDGNRSVTGNRNGSIPAHMVEMTDKNGGIQSDAGRSTDSLLTMYPPTTPIGENGVIHFTVEFPDAF